MARRVFIETAILKSPKLDVLAELLFMDKPETLGRLIAFFHNVYVSDDGLLPSNAEDLARAADWCGDPKEWKDALITSAWVEVDSTHPTFLRLPDMGVLMRIEKA